MYLIKLKYTLSFYRQCVRQDLLASYLRDFSNSQEEKIFVDGLINLSKAVTLLADLKEIKSERLESVCLYFIGKYLIFR